MKHIFNPDVAVICGISEAILYENILYWCEKNKANNQNIIDGVAWTYNKYEAFEELFPYMKLNAIKRSLRHLKELDFIDIRNDLNDNKWDRTNWYSIVDNPTGSDSIIHGEEKSPSIVRKITIHSDNIESSIDHKNNPHIKKQIVNTDINTDIKLINEHFENVWKLYPKKLGKGKILKKAKMGIFLYSLEQWKEIVDRYDKSVGDKQYLMHGSTFFNSGYVDFIDENYDATEISCKPSGGNKTKNHTPDKWTGDQNFPW